MWLPGAPAIVDFLGNYTTSTTNENGLQVLLNKWLETESDFAGAYEIKVGCLGGGGGGWFALWWLCPNHAKDIFWFDCVCVCVSVCTCLCHLRVSYCGEELRSRETLRQNLFFWLQPPTGERGCSLLADGTAGPAPSRAAGGGLDQPDTQHRDPLVAAAGSGWAALGRALGLA